MAKKEFTYRGKTLEELQKMSNEEFSKLLNSRQKRRMKRGINKTLEKRVEKAIEAAKHEKKFKPIKTHLRDAIILPKMVGLSFAIYNGKEFVVRDIMPEMIGHYMGELALTRKKLSHGKAGIGATKSSTAITARK